MSMIFLELPSSIYWASLTIYVQFNFFWLHQLLPGTWLFIQQHKPDDRGRPWNIWRDCFALNTQSRGVGRELHLFQLLLKFLSGVFSLRTIKLEKREPNNPTGNEDDCLRVDLTWSKAHISKACWTYQTFQLIRLETTEDLEQQSEDLEEHSAADSVVYNADHLPTGEGISCNRYFKIHILQNLLRKRKDKKSDHQSF